MGSSLSEPCIYDKLSESIDILRQSGYRYGMSEREIEKFIKQVLETNEPRREPPQFPILRATVKFVVAVGVVLMAVLVFTYPQSPVLMGSVSGTTLNNSSPLSHIRLLELPIAEKYNLHGFHEWWASSSLQTMDLNCSACTDVTDILELTDQLRTSAGEHTRTQPLLLKGGAALSLRVSQMDQFSSVSQTPANFTLLWSVSSRPRESVLQWLFPESERCPLLEIWSSTLQRCRLSSRRPQPSRVQVLGWMVVADGSPDVRLLPVQRCRKHCRSFSLRLEPGDMVFADSQFWLMELSPSGAQDVQCDSAVL